MRTIANIMVIMTREKIPPSAAFRRHFICTPLSMLKGMSMTTLSQNHMPSDLMNLLRQSVITSQAQFNFRVICWNEVADGVLQLVERYSNEETRQEYCMVPMQAKYVARVIPKTGHQMSFCPLTFVPRRLKKRRNEILIDQSAE